MMSQIIIIIIIIMRNEIARQNQLRQQPDGEGERQGLCCEDEEQVRGLRLPHT